MFFAFICFWCLRCFLIRDFTTDFLVRGSLWFLCGFTWGSLCYFICYSWSSSPCGCIVGATIVVVVGSIAVLAGWVVVAVDWVVVVVGWVVIVVG